MEQILPDGTAYRYTGASVSDNADVRVFFTRYAHSKTGFLFQLLSRNLNKKLSSRVSPQIDVLLIREPKDF